MPNPCLLQCCLQVPRPAFPVRCLRGTIARLNAWFRLYPIRSKCEISADHTWGGMTFTSWQFGVFVAIVFGAYYLPPFRTLQIQLLVIASLFFYGYGQPELLPLLAVAVFGTYLFFI